MKSLDELSLGWRTDLIFPRFDGELLQRSDCLVVRTPHNPTFWWGNFLLFDHAPRAGDAARWLAAFDAEIARPQQQSRHLAFGIDASDAFELPRDFVDAGLTLCAGSTPLFFGSLQCYKIAHQNRDRRASAAERFCSGGHTTRRHQMKFRPLHDRVVIKRIEAKARTASGIIIPDTAKEKPQQGEVIAVGPGGRDETHRLQSGQLPAEVFHERRWASPRVSAAT